MKALYLATAVTALLFTASCSETYDIYPAEYDSVIRIKDAGSHQVNVYSVMDESNYKITVTKGGISPESIANATLRVMTPEEFDAYLLESGAGYSYLPSTCYAFNGDNATGDQVSMTFSPKEGYRIVQLTMYPPKIGEFLETYTDVSREPVIPIVLESADSRIDDNSYVLFLKPNYSRPIICFNGETSFELEDGENVANLRLGLDGMESPWELECKVEIDPTVLDEYNSTNHKSMGIMPEGSYDGIGTITLRKGENYAPVNIQLDLDKAGFRTALPLRITQVKMDGVEMSDVELVNNTALVVIDNAEKFKLNLTADDYYSPDDAFTNETCTGYNGVGHDGTGSKALCDGIYNEWQNFWSSCYFQPHHYDEVYNSYIEITLHKSARMVGFDFSTRAYYNKRPYHVRIWAWNGTEWKQIGKDVENFNEAYVSFRPTSGYAYEISPVGTFVADFEFTKVRFSAVKDKGNRLLSGVMHDYNHVWECGELTVYAN